MMTRSVQDTEYRAFWNMPAEQLLAQLETSRQGLTSVEAAERVRVCARDRLTRFKRPGRMRILLGQFKSPIILILIIASVLSMVVHDANTLERGRAERPRECTGYPQRPLGTCKTC